MVIHTSHLSLSFFYFRSLLRALDICLLLLELGVCAPMEKAAAPGVVVPNAG